MLTDSHRSSEQMAADPQVQRLVPEMIDVIIAWWLDRHEGICDDCTDQQPCHRHDWAPRMQALAQELMDTKG